MGWLIDNKEWVFSGIGVLALSIIGLFFKRNHSKQNIEAGNNSINIQGSSNIKVRNGKTEDDK